MVETRYGSGVRRRAFANHIDECAQARRHMPMPGVIQTQPGRKLGPVVEHAEQPAGGEVFGHRPLVLSQ